MAKELNPHSAALTGGCLCGAVRYEIGAVFDVIYCHCIQCRKRTGAPVNCTLAIAGDAFRLTGGKPRAYRTSPQGLNYFCERCGSQLYFEAAAP